MKLNARSNPANKGKVILSFDIEAVYHIEAAAACRLRREMRAELARRLAPQVQWIRQILDKYGVRATFFWVGELAWGMPYLVRQLYRDGHEIACHGWSHRALWALNEDMFRWEMQLNKSVLEDITGEPVIGFRAPTFSLIDKTKWAVSVLYELGFGYDSSVYPVLHDRYGVIEAPRGPFRLQCGNAEILEFPPATWQVGPLRLATGGGGHFRFWPLCICRAGIEQVLSETGYAMLYFHPWEFDISQPRLPLRALQRWRTYIGIGGMRQKLEAVLRKYEHTTARQAAKQLDSRRDELPVFWLQGGSLEQG